MLLKLMISIPIGLLVTFIASQIFVTATANSIRYQTQSSLNVYHANALTILNNTRNLQKALGLISHDDQTTDLTQLSAANSGLVTTIQSCLGSVGTDCKNQFDNVTVDLSSLISSVSQSSRNGSSACSGTSCQFKQTIFGKWNCDQPQRCSQINITLTTVDLKNTTKYNTLTSTLSVAARSLLGRSQINFACASYPRSFFIQNLNYNSGLGSCEPIPHINSIGTVNNAVPARGIAADTFDQVRNPPAQQRCQTGFKTYRLYAGSSECLTVDPNLQIKAVEPAATPAIADPTPAPQASATPCADQIRGPDGTIYPASYTVPRCDEKGNPKTGGANICPGWEPISCSTPVPLPTACPQTCTFAQGQGSSCTSSCSSNNTGSGGKDSGAGGGAGVGGGSSGAGGGASGNH